MAVACKKPPETFGESSLAPRLHVVGQEVSEGFFAEAVVLVEGRSDKAALSAAANLLGVDFESAGIAVISAEGKGNIDKPLLIFRELGIPTYPIWDCDVDKPETNKSQQNLILLRAADPEAAHSERPTMTVVGKHYAHFRKNLEETLKVEITPAVYSTLLIAACSKFDMDPGRDAQKNPAVMKELLELAANQGHWSSTLDALIRAIWLDLKDIVLTIANPACRGGLVT